MFPQEFKIFSSIIFFQEKMEEHLQNVGQFHKTLKVFTDWLNCAEIKMRSQKYASKLVDTITKQIKEHEVRFDL